MLELGFPPPTALGTPRPQSGWASHLGLARPRVARLISAQELRGVREVGEVRWTIPRNVVARGRWRYLRGRGIRVALAIGTLGVRVVRVLAWMLLEVGKGVAVGEVHLHPGATSPGCRGWVSRASAVAVASEKAE